MKEVNRIVGGKKQLVYGSTEMIQKRKILERNKSSGVVFPKEEKYKILINKDETKKEPKAVKTFYKSKKIFKQNNQNEDEPKNKEEEEIKENNYENKFSSTKYFPKNKRT